jgi:hypothetical protein
MPVTAMLESDRIICRPRHDVRGAGRHYLIATRAAVVLLRCSAGDLPDIPVAVRMTLATLTTKWIQGSLVIAIIADASILSAHV